MNRKLVLPLILMLVLALSRWPGLLPPNFSAVYAIMFCAGLYFPGRLGWILPFATQLVTDLLLNVFGYPDVHLSIWSWLGMMLPNYVAYIGILLIGRKLSDPNRSFGTLVGGGIVGALLFYLVTNILAWISLIYSKDIGGLIQALTRGLPEFPSTLEFFRNSLMSGGLFTGLFVGAVKLLQPAESPEEKREPAPASEPSEDGEPVPEESKA